MEPTIIISKEDSEILTDSTLALIKGTVGSGKSRLCLNLLKGLMGSSDDIGFNYSPCPKDKYVYYISTEMSNYHLQKRYIQLTEQLEQEDNLLFFNLYSGEDIFEELKKVIPNYTPYVIIIDQCADLTMSVNDEVSNKKIINRLEKLAQSTGAGIITVIHQNESSANGSKARGHMGSILEQKCISSVAVNKRGSEFIVQATKIREGVPFKLKAVFNKDTQMLKAQSTTNEILKEITFPIGAGSLKEEIENATGWAHTKVHTFIKDLVSKGILETEKSGRNVTYKKLK